MGIDAIGDLAEAGALKPLPGRSAGAVISTELMGTAKLFQFTHNNPVIEMYPATYTINPVTMSGLENFISINSALQVDLWGQANAEVAGDLQISGVGGGFDFVEGALFSPGGKTILALPATAGKEKRSTLIPRLSPAVPATTPRHSVQYVVTEYGVADLTAKSLTERAEALIAIAAPEFRDQLWNDYAALRRKI
jgi:4-hydroxybutyrate CoA-transferase